MSELDYKRADTDEVLDSLGDQEQAVSDAPPTETGGESPAPERKDALAIRWVILPMTAFLCALQSVITVTASNIAAQYPTSTLITVIGFGVMVLMILLLNPFIKAVFRGLVKPLNRAELMSTMAALMVTAGIATFGLTDQLIPLIPAPYNAEWNTPQRGWDKRIHPYLNENLYITDEKVIRDFREGFTADRPADDASNSEWVAYYKDVTQRIPWGMWLKPISLWMVFIGGCYLLFFSLSYSVLHYWSRREKLIFPLAKLPEALLPDDARNQWFPPIFRSPLFWLGFGISVMVLGYNAAAVANWIPLQKIHLGMNSFGVDAVVKNSFFAGLGGRSGMKFLIIFTAIGISFLLPLEISFSVWFYFLFGRFLIMTLCRLGYGQNYDDFPTEWIWTLNPMTALGAGGILLFSAVGLYRCVREYLHLSRRAPKNKRLALLLPVIMLAVSITIVTMWIAWNNVPIYWALLFTMFITLITLGLMRIVAEGGVFWFQAHASFFHLYKMFGLGKILSPTIVGPLLPIYSVLFLDVKTFMAPNVLNAAKMHEDVGGSRIKFHLNVVISIVVAVVISMFHSLVLAYSRGAQEMNNWFYSSGPRSFIEQAARTTTRSPTFEPAIVSWFTLGAIWVGLSMFLRTTLFWFPHPIGFIMMINPLMNELWFSFFIGWVFKKIIVKYGGKTTFDHVRQVMIGLIIGELMIIFICGMISLIYQGDVRFPGIDLNRYGT